MGVSTTDIQEKNPLIWLMPLENNYFVKQIEKELNCSLVFAQILANKDFKDIPHIKSFLNPLVEELHDPFLMKGMNKAVARIQEALAKKEKILVYGDYDADGVTSVAVAVLGLKNAYAEVLFYVPKRLEEGYGLNEDAITVAKQKGVSLIITVDCGITSEKEVALANSLGIDVIITDHHEPPANLPKAFVILNPKQKDCEYPFKELAGVGVIYKLLQALGVEEGLMSFVSIGTIADIVPLISENRILVKNGLQEIRRSSNIGIKSLLRVTKLEGKDIAATDIGFVLAPRINALGRLGDADNSVKMFVTDNPEVSIDIAKLLEGENNTRQKIEKDILESAIEKIATSFDFDKDRVIVLQDDYWHEGVVGIVASRIVERYYRPAVIIGSGTDLCKGSCRSIKGFNIFQALQNVKEFINKFGGHEYAAGLSISKSKIAEFAKKINQYAQENLKEEDLTPKVTIDAVVEFKDISVDLYNECEQLSPFGAKNARPTFLIKALKLKAVPKVVGENHMQFLLSDNKFSYKCVAFKMRHRFEELSQAFLNDRFVSVVFTLNINEWNGSRYVQLNVRDFRVG